MARRIVVTSGKGGAGKTTVTANLGYRLTCLGARVLMADADFGLNNLDVLMEADGGAPFDLGDVLSGKCRPKQALIGVSASPNLYLLPPKRTGGDSVGVYDFKRVISDLSPNFDFILIDCPAGIGEPFLRAISAADEALVVVNPHVFSLRDADKVIAVLKSYGVEKTDVVVNKMRGDLVLSGDMFSAEEIESALNSPVLGVIPEDDEILNGIVYSSRAARAFKCLADSVKNGGIKTPDYLRSYKGFFGSIKRELKGRL